MNIVKGLYKHRNCLDLAIDVIKVTYRGPDYLKARVALVRHTDGAMFWDGLVTVTIQNSDLPNWQGISLKEAD